MALPVPGCLCHGCIGRWVGNCMAMAMQREPGVAELNLNADSGDEKAGQGRNRNRAVFFDNHAAKWRLSDQKPAH